MFDVVKVLQVTNKDGIQPGSVIIENCADYFPELEGYNVVCAPDNLEAVRDYIFKGAEQPAYYMKIFDKYPRNAIKMIAEKENAGKSYTNVFVGFYGDCQKLLDAVNGKEPLATDVLSVDSAVPNADGFTEEEYTDEWYPLENDDAQDETVASVEEVIQPKVDAGTEGEVSPQKGNPQQDNSQKDNSFELPVILEEINNKLSVLLQTTTDSDVTMSADDRDKIVAYLGNIAPSIFKNALLEAASSSESPKELQSVGWLAGAITGYLKKIVVGGVGNE